LTVVPRLLLDLTARAARPPLGGIWGDTRIVLPARTTYRDILTGAIRESAPATKGARLAVASLFDTVPVALLESTTAPPATAGTRHALIQR
jgi:maltooligosyltrehalose synthase